MPGPLKNPALRRLRGMKMLQLTLDGASRKEVATRFKVSTKTVSNEMEFLEKEGLLQKTEDSILMDLYPLALEVMKKHLEEQKSKKGRTSIEGAKAILKDPLKRAAQPKTDSGEEETLERWVIERRAKKNVEVDGSVVRPDRILDITPEDGRRALQSVNDDQREEVGVVRDGRAEGESGTGTEG